MATLWKSQHREITSRFGGASMRPGIPPDSELVVRCGDATAAPGDVVLVLRGDDVLVHRLVARRAGRWLLTRGDACAVPDPPLADDCLVGRVLGIRHGAALTSIASAPRSLARSLALATSRATLQLGVPAGTAWIRTLWWLRRCLVVRPGALMRKLRGGVRPSASG